MYLYLVVYLHMQTSTYEHDMAMEKITARITDDVMQELGWEWPTVADIKKGATRAGHAISDQASRAANSVKKMTAPSHQDGPHEHGSNGDSCTHAMAALTNALHNNSSDDKCRELLEAWLKCRKD
jgi:hypothetical protein